MWAGSRTFILEQCQYGSRTVPDYFAGAGNPSNIIISTNIITLISYHAGIHNFYLTVSPLFLMIFLLLKASENKKKPDSPWQIKAKSDICQFLEFMNDLKTIVLQINTITICAGHTHGIVYK